jgi:fumarate reductase (CoM/CoB) subunit A
MINRQCDVLIVGGGSAAARAAIAAVENGAKVLLVDKGRFGCSGTSPLGLHGYATTFHPDDSEERLIDDIISNGQQISDRDVVETAVRGSREEVSRLEEFGFRFVRLKDGIFDIYKGSGATAPHGLTFDEVETGLNPVVVLGKYAWKKGVQLLEDVMVTTLVVAGNRVIGALGVDRKGEGYAFSAGAVVLAAGGANGIYPNVTPRIAHKMFRTTGDGYVLALNAGLPIIDMEFANFRDTPPLGRLGGTLLNARDEDVMAKYDPGRKDGYSRGKIVEAIYLELRSNLGPLRITVSEEQERRAAFLAEEYKSYVKAAKEGHPPPVSISFQRLLGGVRIKPDASTAIDGLYAAGENTGGFHGADRLQGASFMETQVMGRIAGENAARYSRVEHDAAAGLPQETTKAFSETLVAKANQKGRPCPDFIRDVQRVAWNCAGIVRQATELENGLKEISALRAETSAIQGSAQEICEAENLAKLAEVVIRSCLARNETRGTHRRADFRQTDNSLRKCHTAVFENKKGELEATSLSSSGYE